MLEVKGASREINDNLILENREDSKGWSVFTHKRNSLGGWDTNQVYWFDSEEKAEAFFYGMIAGACVVEV